MKVGLLTSGGDCQGLNASIRGVAKTLYHLVPDTELCGIQNGYYGLADGLWRKMDRSEFSGILRLGGTILGTSRTPAKRDGVATLTFSQRVEIMLENYRKGGFDALVILGGDGTHKTAHMLSQGGANIVTMPKTIDNDIWGTELTFGFDSAVEKATSMIDAIHTTAASHGRVFIIELMGHNVGWIALYAGIAGGADVILIPEITYRVDSVIDVIEQRNKSGKHFTIIAMAEGAASKDVETSPEGHHASARLSKVISSRLEQDVRIAIPGHFQRGGDPTPTDRILCSRLGARAGEMVVNGEFGKMVSLQGNHITSVPLAEVVGRLKSIPADCEILHQARLLGLSFGE